MSGRATLTFYWENLGPTHVDRLERLAADLSASHRIVALQDGEQSRSQSRLDLLVARDRCVAHQVL